MKKLAIIILAILFLVNTGIASAWAKPCHMGNGQSVNEQVVSNNMTHTPCHEPTKQDRQSHCDGECLCVHAITSFSILSNTVNIIDIPIIKSGRLTYDNDPLISRSPTPPHRPPKYIS